MRSGQAELLRGGQAGRTARCESVRQVHVEPKSQWTDRDSNVWQGT